MTVHAYDPLGVSSLLQRMAEAADELRTLQCSDPLAESAIAAARRVSLDLSTRWMPLARSVLCSDPLGRAATERPTIDEWVAPGPHRLDDTTTGTFLAALSAAWPTELATDHGALVVLAAHLRLLADTQPDTTHLLIELDGLTELLESLATEHRSLQADGESTVAVVEVLRAIAALLPNDLDALSGLLHSLGPYAAALVVQYLALAPRDLAHITAELIERAADEPAPDHEVTPGALLLPVVARNVAACRSLLEQTRDRPWLLLDSGADPGTVAHVVLTATDPATTDPCTAQQLVVPHARWLATHDRPATSELLADMLAPWLLQLGPLDREWSLSVDDRTQLLAAAVDDPVTMQRLVAIADRVHAAAIDSLAADGGRGLEEVAALLGLLSELVVRDAERRADHAIASWGLMVSIVGVAAALVPGGVVVGMATSTWFSIVAALPPLDRRAVAARADAAQEHALATGAAAVALAIHQQWVGSGRLPPTAPPPPLPDPSSDHPTLDMRRRIDDWLASLPGGWSGPLATEADRLVSTMLNAHGAGAELAD